MKPILKIDFCDFWGHFEKDDNYFYNLLSNKFDVRITNDPDFLIYSCYGVDHLRYTCHRIFYNGENQKVDWNACDFSFSFAYIENNPRHYRLPNWIFYGDPSELTSNKNDLEQIFSEKSRFCNMIVSNPYSKKRIRFFEKLSEYKKVDSGGRYRNNIGSPVDNKREFIRKYKFTIAFENSSAPGYTTEKLFEPMLENTIPIYWGDPLVNRDFNPRSFLNYHDYGSDEALIDQIIALDQDDNRYFQMLKEPWFNNNQMPSYLEENNILDHFQLIFSMAETQVPVARKPIRWLYWASRQVNKIDYEMNKVFAYRKPFR